MKIHDVEMPSARCWKGTDRRTACCIGCGVIEDGVEHYRLRGEERDEDDDREENQEEDHARRAALLRLAFFLR